jgi:hypothetical protein
LDWEPARGVHYYVVHRDGSGVAAHFTGEAFFAFHTINAFEENDDIHIDLCSYPVENNRVFCVTCEGCEIGARIGYFQSEGVEADVRFYCY